MSIINELSAKVLDGKLLSFDETEKLLTIAKDDIYDLLATANKIRKKFTGNKVELCAITAGIVGRCSEDCAFCAQSGHHQAVIPEKCHLDRAEIVNKALQAEQQGIIRYSLVNSGYRSTEKEFAEILAIYAEIKSKTKLELCASLGVLTPEKARQLLTAGVTRYHHNVETSRSFYPQICTTHNYEKRLQTIQAAKQAGMQVCCGGIISVGETARQRLEMAFEIRNLNVDAIPINILSPVPGTPLERQIILSPLETLKTIAIFRFVLPAKSIRLAGGRVTGLRDLQVLAFLAGANATITGDYLTTDGRSTSDDWQMIKDLGFRVGKHY
ncbi:MAG: biotin synthase BioB [Desulfotomaculum sp.]|nr:biotin synthase BioB [Desulfotomaculum sp.]